MSNCNALRVVAFRSNAVIGDGRYRFESQESTMAQECDSIAWARALLGEACIAFERGCWQHTHPGGWRPVALVNDCETDRWFLPGLLTDFICQDRHF